MKKIKYMVISDIHGDIYNLNRVINIYYKEQCSKLLILGDLYNYDLNVNRMDIVNRLNLMKEDIIACLGNCDNDLRDIMFDMPDINKTKLNRKNIVLTHGHLYNKEDLLNTKADIIFMGHTHIASIEEINKKLFVNPGSISKSRRGENSFAIVDEKSVTIRNLDNIILEEYK